MHRACAALLTVDPIVPVITGVKANEFCAGETGLGDVQLNVSRTPPRPAPSGLRSA